MPMFASKDYYNSTLLLPKDLLTPELLLFNILNALPINTLSSL